MVEHLRTIQQRQERHIYRYSTNTLFSISLQITITPLLNLEECTFFIVALAVRHISVTVGIRERITILQPTHSRLIVSIRGIIPAKHTITDKFTAVTIAIISPMLQNHICIWRNCFHAFLVVIFYITHRGTCCCTT